MADITIPQLNAATSVSGTDVMVISQAGVTKKVEVDKLLAEVRSDLNNSHDQIVKLQSEKEDKASKQIISDVEYDALVASGEILPDVLYYTYET